MRQIASFFLFIATGCCWASPDLREQLALAEKDGQVPSQIEICRRILEKKSADAVQIQSRLLDLCIEANDDALAQDTLTRYRKSLPPAKMLIATAHIAVRNGKTSEAITEMEKFLKKNPEEAEVVRKFTALCEEAGKPEKVVAFINSLPAEKCDAQFLMCRAKAHRALGNFSEAIADAFAAAQKDLLNEDVKKDLPSFERLKVALPNLEREVAKDDYRALVTHAFWALYADLPARALASTSAAATLIPSAIAPLLLRYYASDMSNEEIVRRNVVRTNGLPKLSVLNLVAQYDKEFAGGYPPSRLKRAAALRSIGQPHLAQEDDKW